MTRTKKHRIPIQPFAWNAGDPLAAEYQLVATLVDETLRSGWLYYTDLDLSKTKSGTKVLEADAEASTRLVLALLAHLNHFDSLVRKVKALSTSEIERMNWHHSPEWEAVWFPRQVSAQTLRRIMRRKLPLKPEHLTKLADWIASAEWQNDNFYPLKAFVKAVENYGEISKNETELRSSLARLALLLRNSHSKDLPKLGNQIEAALGAGGPSLVTADEPFPQTRSTGPDPSRPAHAGAATVLVQLKQFLGILSGDNAASTEIGFDHFQLRHDSPLREEHELINMFLPEVVERPTYYSPNLSLTETGRAMLARDDLSRGRILLAAAERCVSVHFVTRGALEDHRCWQSQYAVRGVFGSLLKSNPELERNGIFDLLLYLSALNSYEWTTHATALESLFGQIEKLVGGSPLTEGERHVLHRLRCQSVRACPFGRPPPEVVRLNTLLQHDPFMMLVPGEAWSDAVNADVDGLASATRAQWVEVFQHAATATGARPPGKWLKSAKEKITCLGAKEFARALQRWFSLVNERRTVQLLGSTSAPCADTAGVIHDDNSTCLRGLLWMSPEVTSPDLIRAIGALTVSCYRKIPGTGPRAVKVGNAGVYALGQINEPLALGQLALLKVKVKFGTAQKEIEKAFNVAAERSGLPREELEEMSVPTYGLTDVGVCEERLGEFTARLGVTGTTTTELTWVKADGKAQRAVPASIKNAHKEDLKELQAAAKDIQKMLPAQRERIDGLFLQQKVWPLATWKERYLDHPLIGTLARRILWEFKTGDTVLTAIWFNDRLVDLDLKPVSFERESTSVQLWHPIGRSQEEVVAWRSWLDAQQIQQPFKQAHREVYPLTDAERNTQTYSNRYAAHVLKQHQFNSLCALRGWKNKLRLMVDDEYPPATLHLPQWGLRAEFWIEGLGTDYGADTNESGVYLYLSTDQVRFYRVESAQRMAHASGGGYHPGHYGQDAEPLALEAIPPLVFSEVMRDVDMFVGVGSVGNDPAWSDGGPQGRYQQYWQNYSFGELNASARTRKDVLERLVPKLKIANRCSFADKFLIVKGTIRTYKIHLGSGNILMEPNDQYLCIVPRQGDTEDSVVLLPFEGDRTLSIILSKAFLLADDTKIKDGTITRQIRET